jgi:phosphoribosylanthranilate isomerase
MMVKICGITNEEDARAATDSGATALGFNFWSGSPRYVTLDRAAAIVEKLVPGVWSVGLFVNETPSQVEAVVQALRLDVVQLYGDGPAPSGVRVWKAAAVTPEFRLQDLAAYPVEAVVIDAPAGRLYGGTGKTFDWKLAVGSGKKIILAGGLDANNVRQAIRIVRPWGVDACSRLESVPGKKDHQKMAAFLKAALNGDTE